MKPSRRLAPAPMPLTYSAPSHVHTFSQPHGVSQPVPLPGLPPYTSLLTPHNRIPRGRGLPCAARNCAQWPAVYQFVLRISVPMSVVSVIAELKNATAAAASFDVPLILTTHMPGLFTARRKLMKSVGCAAQVSQWLLLSPHGRAPAWLLPISQLSQPYQLL